jgi:hypothetical protein
MVKYRSLSTDELKTFEKEFIDFLVVNGIIAEDWEKIKKETPEKAERIIDNFSDVILEGTLRKVEFIEFITPKSIKCFQCLSKEIILVGVDVEQNSTIDFTKENWNDNLKNLKIYTTKKEYIKEGREKEIFNMLNGGAAISKGELFKQMCLAL